MMLCWQWWTIWPAIVIVVVLLSAVLMDSYFVYRFPLPHHTPKHRGRPDVIVVVLLSVVLMDSYFVYRSPLPHHIPKHRGHPDGIP